MEQAVELKELLPDLRRDLQQFKLQPPFTKSTGREVGKEEGQGNPDNLSLRAARLPFRKQQLYLRVVLSPEREEQVY